MEDPQSSDRYDYIGYIDESGDTGLKRVKPIDTPGASEWMVLSAVVIRRTHEADVVRWMKDICRPFRNHQRFGFHFRNLKPAKKLLVCEGIRKLPLRIFVVASNKKNMRGYLNPWAALIPSNNWFYCWMTRVLLERVTFFVNSDSLARYGEPRLLKIEYSNRGGLSYAQMDAYYTYLQHRVSIGRNELTMGDLSWQVMRRGLLQVHQHDDRAGLHFADAAASSFFKACDKYDTGAIDTQFAKLLEPRMGRFPDILDGQIAGYGVKLLPGLRSAKLDLDQTEIFRFYGYPHQWWAPDSNNR